MVITSSLDESLVDQILGYYQSVLNIIELLYNKNTLFYLEENGT